MNPLVKAFSGAAVRWLMTIAGAHGIDLGNDQAETLVNAALITAPIFLSMYQKWRAHEQIETAKAQAELAARPRE